MGLKIAVYAPNTPSLIGDMGIKHTATERALEDLGQRIKPSLDGVFVVSPHFVTGNAFGVVDAELPQQIFDFSGFPREFYEIKYTPRGIPHMARSIVENGSLEGIPVAGVRNWGLDHGAWSPLYRMFPDQDVPVLPVSIAPSLGPEKHEKLGKVLRISMEGGDYMLLVTGSIIHRLDLWVRGSQKVPENAKKYLNEVTGHMLASRWEQIWHIPRDLYRSASPEGGEYPFRILSGALGMDYEGKLLASEVEFGSASLTTIEFTRKNP